MKRTEKTCARGEGWFQGISAGAFQKSVYRASAALSSKCRAAALVFLVAGLSACGNKDGSASRAEPAATAGSAAVAREGAASTAVAADHASKPARTYNEAVYCLALSKYLDGEDATTEIQSELDAAAIRNMATAMRLSGGGTEEKVARTAADVQLEAMEVLDKLNQEHGIVAGSTFQKDQSRLWNRRLGEFRLMCKD